MKAEQLFTLPDTLPFADFFQGDKHPWEWVAQIKAALKTVNFASSHKPIQLPEGVHIVGDCLLYTSDAADE